MIFKDKTYVIFLIFTQFLIGQNLIKNGNFESNKDHWEGFNNQVLKDDLTNSFVGNVNNSAGSLLQVFSLTAGKTYNVAFDYRWVSGNGNYNMTVRVKKGTTGDDIQTLKLDTTPDVWKTVSFTFTAPENISKARIVFYKVNENRPLRIDNVIIIDEDFESSLIDLKTPLNAQPNGVAGDWVLDFSDEFNDESLDLTKWRKSVSTKTRQPRWSKGIHDWRWIAENAFVNTDGKLVLRATKTNNTTMRCGSVESRGLYEVKYGYLEAKIKIAKTAKGNHTAFWLQGKNQGNVDNSAADGAEVDIFESAWTSNTSKAVVHYDGYGSFKKNHTIPFNTPNIHDDKFHTYGLLWTENVMYVYYDGIQVTSTNANKPFPFSTNPSNGQDLVPQVEEWLWLSVGASFGDGDFTSQPIGLLSDALVDYVRVFKPSQTLSIKNNTSDTVQIHPNPVHNFLNVKALKPYSKITIFDIKGKEILQKKNTTENVKINFQGFAKGVYFIKINQKDKITIKKIIF